MSVRLSFVLRGNSSIRQLMDVFRAQFHKEIRFRKVTKYVFESEKTYLLIAERENFAAAVLLQQDGGSWRALISPQRVWNEEVSFYRGEESILAELKTFFTQKCADMITVVSAWTSSDEKEEPRQSEDDDVTPLYSEISEEGTMTRCPKCGAAEIIFPNQRKCSKCGTEIVRKGSYPEPDEAEEEAGPPPTVVQSKGAEVGKCMVCGMGIHQGEPLACCPSCGGRAHRVHLLEFVHVKGECPSCHNHIVEEDIAERVSHQEVAGSASNRRTRVKAGFPKKSGAE